jgi:sugar phosphate isomerase/epimerase
MRLAVFTDEVSQDLEKALKLAVRFKLDGVELRSVWDKPVQSLSNREVDRIRRLLDQHGLRMAAIASPVFKCELDDEDAQLEHLSYLRRCAQIARALDTNIIRLFAFWKRGPSKPVWDRIKAQFAPAVPIAEEESVLLGLENEASTYLATAAEVRRFITEVGSPVLRSVWDPCNEVYAEEGITPYPDAYGLVEPWTVHVHVKDAKKDAESGEAEVVPVGEGVVDWKGQLRHLLAKGYDGYASLETHWRPHALTEDQTNRPGGEAFSESGEYASDVCMRHLMGILAEARRETN